MNRQEVKSAINDFRKAFRDDLGAPISYGRRTFESSGGFSIDSREETIDWVTSTSTNVALNGTSSLASSEDLIKAGLSTNCTGIVTCIYEDILDIQPVDEETGQKRLIRETVLNDKIKTVLNGTEEEFQIVDFSFAFQLRDTYIFIKFGVVAATGV